MSASLNRTALYNTHVSLGARMVPFAGWEMPIQYSDGILAEARAVRNSSGIFDVSHMGRFRISGRDAAGLIDWIVTADVPAMAKGRGRYTLMCTDEAGVLDDGIVYRTGDEEYLVVCNAANRGPVWEWLSHWNREKFPHANMLDRTFEVGMIAFQGPAVADAIEQLCPGLTERVRPFRIRRAEVGGIPVLAARTGYTGEDGFELMPDASQSAALAQTLLGTGAVPCGLGARDVLRLEAGLLLHGSDMDRTTNPYEAGLERFVVPEKTAVWSEALKRVSRNGLDRKLVGFRMIGRGVPRHGYAVLNNGETVGQVSSGGYSPTLDRYIGMGYVSVELTTPGTRFVVDVRGRHLEAEVVELPFYSRRRG